MNTALGANDFDISPFVNAGFALHWLKPKSKAPIGDKWSERPIASLETLLATRRAGNNVGVRLGEPSALVAGGYLHAIDLDIRVADMADEAWDAFARLFPGVPAATLPCVASGSGGESRHLYFVTDRPFSSKMLAVSDGKHRRYRQSEGREVWSNNWEMELFGSGKHLVLPGSLHPDTGKPYTWLREFDFAAMDLGICPCIPSSAIDALGAAETVTYAFETRPPLTFKPGQLARELSEVAVSDLHYDDWIKFGQALHHQFGGSDEGFDLWLEHTKRSTKFEGEKQVREMRRVKWRSFGKRHGQPVTMQTVRRWVLDARGESYGPDAFEDLPDAPAPPLAADDFDELLGGAATSAADDFDSIFENDNKSADSLSPLAWDSLLDRTEEGGLKATLHNLKLIVENDVRTKGVAAFNEFTQEVVQRSAPGRKPPKRANAAKPTLQLKGATWRMHDPVNGDLWVEAKDNAIRMAIEAPASQGGYGIKVPDRDLRAAIDIVGRENAFHPVREYLNRLTWDGIQRAERLFIDYLGAPDDAYTRDVARLTLVGAVTRVFEPGAKFDFAPILEGSQGKGKSTFIQVLARDWSGELEGDFEDARAMVEAMQGVWISELAELGGFVRADVRHIKAFVSRSSDKVRLAYAKRAQEYHRQSVLIGSTNDRRYLQDATGGRRFWPVSCTVDAIDTDGLERVVDQIWAEALALYRAMRVAQPKGTLPLYLTNSESKRIAEQLQEAARVETVDDGLAGQIAAWLEKPTNTGSIDHDGDADGAAIVRNETCHVEIWIECMGKDRGSYTQQASQMIGRSMANVPNWSHDGSSAVFAKYGRQRVYYRGGKAGMLSRMT